MMWKASVELTSETKGSPGGFFFASVFPVLIGDWSSSSWKKQWLGHVHQVICPWQLFLFSTHPSISFFLHSSITVLFNELASTACTPSTPSSLHQFWCHSPFLWHVIYTLCPLVPCCLSPVKLYTNQPLHLFPVTFVIYSLSALHLKCLTLRHSL